LVELGRPVLSTLAKSGDHELVERFLTEDVVVEAAAGVVVSTQVQLYTAAFWGLHEAVNELTAGEIGEYR
jgi:hypothetical protein